MTEWRTIERTLRRLRAASSQPPAIVVGFNLNGLGTARALGRRGVSVLALSGGRDLAPARSRYAEVVNLPNLMDQPDVATEFLLRIGDQFSGPPVVFASSDLFLEEFANNLDRLGAGYRFPIADPDTVRLILEKTTFCRYCIDQNLPIPPTVFPRSPAELRRLTAEFRYPVVLKPTVATIEWRNRGLKILSAQTPEELAAAYEMAAEIQPDLVVQEVIPGPDSALRFSLCYIDRAGVTRGMFTGRKIRQWRPRFGITSMAEAIHDETVRELTEQLLTRLNYRGYGSVEFKVDPRDGTFRIMEITGRTWFPHALSERCGVNLPYIAYCDLTGRQVPPAPWPHPTGRKWIAEESDWKSARFYRSVGELTVRDWIRSYRGPRTWAHFALDDPIPGLVVVAGLIIRAAVAPLRLLVRYARRLLGRASGPSGP